MHSDVLSVARLPRETLVHICWLLRNQNNGEPPARQPALCALATACRLLSEPALDVLWHTTASLVPLLIHTLPDDLCATVAIDNNGALAHWSPPALKELHIFAAVGGVPSTISKYRKTAFLCCPETGLLQNLVAFEADSVNVTPAAVAGLASLPRLQKLLLRVQASAYDFFLSVAFPRLQSIGNEHDKAASAEIMDLHKRFLWVPGQGRECALRNGWRLREPEPDTDQVGDEDGACGIYS